MSGSVTGRVSLFPILLVNFIGTLGFSIVLPFLVTLVTKLGGNALVYGLMGATYSAFQLVGAPVLGRWSDRYGRRRVLLLSQLGTLASWVIFFGGLVAPSRALTDVDSAILGSFVLTLPLVILFAARALDGLTGGNVSVANAYLADVTEEKDRKAAFGRMAVAGNLGFIVGPVLAGLLGATRYGEALPVLAAMAISAVASFVIARFLPESQPCRLETRPEQTQVRKVFGQEPKDCYRLEGEKETRLRDLLGIANVGPMLLLYFLIFLGFNLFYTAFPVHSVRGLAWSITDIGWFFSFLGLTTVLVQGPLLQRISTRFSDVALTVAGGVILASAFLGFVRFEGAALYGAAALFSLGNGLMWPSFLSLLSRAAGNRYQGAVQGFGASAGSLASILGLVAGGLLYERVGASTFLGSALLVLLAVAITLFLSRRLGVDVDR